MRFVESNSENMFFLFFMIKNFSLRIDDHTITRVTDAVAIFTHTIHPNNVTLIFDGPCLQQSFPGGVPSFGPVGNVDQKVVFGQPPLRGERGSLSRPNRKSQIIANQQIYFPSLY